MEAYNNIGIRRRLRRFFRRDGRALIFAMDHGFEHGPTDFEENWEHINPRIIIRKVVRAGIDGVMMLPGIARIAGEELVGKDVGLMVKLTAKQSSDQRKSGLCKTSSGLLKMRLNLVQTLWQPQFTGEVI